MNKLQFPTLAIAIMAGITASSAKVTLKPIWGDSMVIQRNQEVIFSGSSDQTKGSVTISPSWDTKSYSAKIGSDGAWSVAICTPDAGGGYKVTFDDKSGAPTMLNDILLGDVWLCMGQSNMDLKMCGARSQPVEGVSNDIALARETTNIRLFNMNSQLAVKPADNYSGEFRLY